MATYVVLLNWTQQGIANVKDGPGRVQTARKAVEDAGGKWLGYYVTMGQYDGVAIVDLPSDEAVATMLLATAMRGNVQTQTMRAFTEEEFAGIVSKLP